MEYTKAKDLKIGDVINPRNKDIYGIDIVPYGNYLVKDIEIDNKDVFITLDNGQIINHKDCNHPPITCCGGKRNFYCSWFGDTNDIRNTNLSDEQLKRCGILPH